MSTAIPTTLTHEQRNEAFTKALALEEGLEKLEALKAACLAALERQAETMRQQHARLMRAATTGANPEAPEQQALPLGPTLSAAPAVAEASPGRDEQPPPEPPKGGRRPRVRKPTAEKTGEKRAETTGAARARPARTSARSSRLPAQPAVTQDFLDALPAPRVPCCECTHSVADHKDGTGRCSGKVQGKPCKCRHFLAMAVDLPGAPGWKVRRFRGDSAHTLLGEGKETPPAWWKPGYGLAFDNGSRGVSCVFSHLGMSATTLSYENDPRWNWVPREVLRALAEFMGATWPEPREEPADSEDIQTEQAPASKDDTPCACDSCGETFKASELQPVGNGYYCATCKTEADEQDEAEEVDPRRLSGDALEQYREHLREMVGSDTVTCAACRREHLAGPCPLSDGGGEPAEQDGEVAGAPSAEASYSVPDLDNPFEVPATDGKADPSFDAVDLSKLHPALGQPPVGYLRTYKVTIDGSSPRACEACGTRERPRAFVGFNREDRKRKRGEYTGGGGFAMALCLVHCTLEGVELAWSNRAHHVERERLARLQAEQDTNPTATAAPVASSADSPKPTRRRPSRKTTTAASAPSAPLCGKVHEKTGSRCADPAGHPGGWCHGPPEPGSGARLRWKNPDYQYVGPSEGDGEVQDAAARGAWRVDLPERNQHTIIRLWLVNDTTGARKPATWWSGVSALRRGHHLSGKLEGEALAAQIELESWWKENADAVVRPLAEACRDGKVPGLKVYEPETLGAGPHRYALSNGRVLEAWEAEGEEAEPHVDFVSPTERGDVQLRVGPFVLSPDGHLTTANAEAAEWSAENEAVVTEAEAFVARGFIFELRQEVVS